MSTTSSFTYDNVKYFVPFHQTDEYWIKPKYFVDGETLLSVLTDMFPRKILGNHKELTQSYWIHKIQQQQCVSMLLFFHDAIYQEYSISKPTYSDNNFVTVTNPDFKLPHDLFSYFLPPNYAATNSSQLFMKNLRIKLRISNQHVHPRSIVLPYSPTIIHRDDDIVVVHKPFGIPSMAEANYKNDWNSILTWVRNQSNKDTKCDCINRLDVDVSGLMFLGLSGKYRKQRGFQQKSSKKKKQKTKITDDTETNPTTSITTAPYQKKELKKLYLAIIPKQIQAIRITTPKLKFDKNTSKATMILNKNSDGTDSHCRTCIYPVLQLHKDYTLVVICLEESGQRHQIRFHLSLIHKTIPNDHLYHNETISNKNNDNILILRSKKTRTGVGGVCKSSTTNGISKTIGVKDDESNYRLQKDYESDNYNDNTMNGNKHHMRVQVIPEKDFETFLQTYVYNINGVVGFEQISTEVTWKEKFIQRQLYPFREKDFQQQLHYYYSFDASCGKCKALKNDDDDDDNSVVHIQHGIYLHSWRYFHPTTQHTLFEADLPPSTNQGKTHWWPVKIVRNES